MSKELREDMKREREAATAAPLEGQLSATLTDRLLLAVRLRRQEDDEREGILRDYPDGTNGRRYKGPTSHTDRQAVLEASAALEAAFGAASPTWRNHLELAVARVNAEGEEERLEQQLVSLAALAVAWAEGIRMRADRRRVDLEERRRLRVVKEGKVVELEETLALAGSRPLPWWKRLLSWLTRR